MTDSYETTTRRIWIAAIIIQVLACIIMAWSTYLSHQANEASEQTLKLLRCLPSPLPDAHPTPPNPPAAGKGQP
jgi:hypothetical protein